MSHLNSLLQQVNFVITKNEELLNQSGGKFNIFKVLGVNHYENTHSSILAEFLNPKGSHGMEHIFLESFSKSLGIKFNIPNFNFSRAIVKKEYPTLNGRIDILIEDNQNNGIIIENKIYASDQFEQLIRYDKFAKKYNNNFQIFYLTLFGDEASNQSGGGIEYSTLSYSETIINWLDRCVELAVRKPIVRETIIQYINHLRGLTNQEMDTSNQKEVIDILQNFQNLKAAKSIFQNYNETYNYLAQKHFIPKMKSFIESLDLDFTYEYSQEPFIRFYITSSSWDGKYWISFTIEGNKCHYGLCNNRKINFRVSEINRIKIHKNLNDLGVTNRKQSDWWPFYEQFENLSIETWEQDIVNSNNYIELCQLRIMNILKAIEYLDLSLED